MPRFDGYLVVGQRAREYYLNYGASEKRMFSAPHAVDNAFFAAESACMRTDRAGLRRRFGLPESATVWLFAGKLVGRKRPSDFLEAIGRAAARDGQTWALVVGDGPLRLVLEQTVRKAGWPVRFAGFLNQSQMPAAYAASDALVLPSNATETWGLVVNEAMASGLPAIVSDQVGCGPDLVRPNETGMVFRCGDVDQLTRMITCLSSEPPRLSRLAAGARRHIANYSIEAAVRGTLAAIRAVGRGPTRTTLAA
jgi:glycosyltransferase involved in cell wall biosynthesis